MKIDELWDQLTKPAQEQVTVEEVTVSAGFELEMALILLQECGQILDELSDKQGQRLNRAEQLKIAKAADEVFEFLRDTDVDYGEKPVEERM